MAPGLIESSYKEPLYAKIFLALGLGLGPGLG